MQTATQWYSLKAQTPAQSELLIYDKIGADGITAQSLVTALSNIPNASIHLRINSPGGDVFDGLAIYNALKGRKVTTTIEGMAASIASVIALAGKPIRAHKSAYFMVHDPSGMVIGGASSMRETADVLDKIRNTIASIYAERTGKSVSSMLDMMSDTSWLTAEEAKAQGFIDEILGGTSPTARFDLTPFAHVPAQVWNCYGKGKRPIPAHPPARRFGSPAAVKTFNAPAK